MEKSNAERFHARQVRFFLLAVCTMSLFSCTGTRPTTLGLVHSHLARCPDSPNCVSSEATDPKHAILPFELVVPSEEAWRLARLAVSSLARTQIITETDNYLHAECRSALFGFVDDLELHLMTDSVISVRSASRLGYSDMGVNRRRIEHLRLKLAEQGIIR